MDAFVSIRSSRPEQVPIVARVGVDDAAAAHVRELIESADWAAVYHAYGPADDVPGQLWAVAVGDEKTRGEAWTNLWGNVHHQGTIYEAMAPALPVFVAIAEWRDHPDRADAIEMLHHVAIAEGVVVWRWEGDEWTFQEGPSRAITDEMRAAVRTVAERLLSGWREEDEAVRRALLLLLAGLPDLHDMHRGVVEEMLPAEQVAGFRAILSDEDSWEVSDAANAFEDWVHEPRL